MVRLLRILSSVRRQGLVTLHRANLTTKVRCFVAHGEQRKPVPPTKDECCGNGCESCVWLAYFEELERYRSTLQEFEK